MPANALTTVATDQKRWSLTANQLKASLDWWRTTALVLAVAGAILGTLAAQIPDGLMAKLIGYGGAAAIALIGVLRQARLGPDRVQAWVVARAASEALKREMFLYRARAGRYSAANPLHELVDRRGTIVGNAGSAQAFTVEPSPSEVKVPSDTIDAGTYVTERIDNPIKWFRERAQTFAGNQHQFEQLELMLAAAGAILGVVLTGTGTRGGAWMAVVTTIVAALGSYIQAQRYNQLIVTYRATAARLEDVRDRWLAAGAGSLGDLVAPCETVHLEENQGWVAETSAAARNAAPTTTPVTSPPPPAPPEIS